MNTINISLQRLTYFMALLLLATYFIIVCQSILAPLAFGALFAFMLKPLSSFFERKIKWRILAIILAMFSAFVPLIFTTYFFSAQFVDVIQGIPSITDELNAGIATIYNWASQLFSFSKAETDAFFSEQASKLLKAPLAFLGVGVSSSTSFFVSFFLCIIYVFLFLLYRSSFNSFMLLQAGPDNRKKVSDLLEKIQSLVQRYIYGMLSVILILGILNSTGLWIIGIRHPLFWGFLAAALAIIPYIGTFVGGLLPFLFALATTGEIWQPIAVVVLFGVVQALEGNFITPNVVGSAVNVNPLAAIIALLLGGKIWGISGMVLALPAIAVLKEILKQFDAWRPVGFLLSDDISNGKNVFEKKWDNEKFRLRNFFKK
jgi:predicted PurR-regulated permease PerM